jgi:hypothetical protein
VAAAGWRAGSAGGSITDDALASHALLSSVVDDARADAAARDGVANVPAAGIADITSAMVESLRLNEVLQTILVTMFRARACAAPRSVCATRSRR